MIASSLTALAAPTIDGVVSSGEWRGGAAHLGLMTADGTCFPSPVRVRTLREGTTAYVAVESAVPKRGILSRVMKDAPGGLAGLDDAVLLKFADGRVVSVNALGAVGDDAAHFGEMRPREMGLKTASTVTNGWWTFEAAVSGEVTDVGRHFAWAADPRAADAFVGAGDSLFPADGKPVVQFDKVEGGRTAYRLTGAVANPTDRPLRHRLELRAKGDSSQPAVLVRDFKLAPRAVAPFELKGAILGDEEVKIDGAGRTWSLRPNNEVDPFVADASAADCVRCRFAYYPSHNRLHLDVNVSGVPDWRRDVKGVCARILDGAGMVLTHELAWRWNSTVWQKVHKALLAWGYRTPAVRVWNYWNDDEPYPLEVKGIDKTASIVMARKDAQPVGTDHRAPRPAPSISKRARSCPSQTAQRPSRSNRTTLSSWAWGMRSEK